MCHLVIARIAPHVRVFDIAHGISGVRAGSAILAQALPYAPPGVHLAVVDPGVGTARRGVAIVTGGGSTLVGPDNGLLLEAADVLGGVTAAFELSDPGYRLELVSATFHGRDVFAPAAAHLVLGLPPARLGPGLDAHDLVRLPPSFVRAVDGVLEADVLRTDWFGNLQLSARAGDLRRAGLEGGLLVECAAGVFDAMAGRTFADVAPGELLVYVDAAGHVAVACNGGSAREVLQSPERVTLKRKL